MEFDPFEMSEFERGKFAILGRLHAYLSAYQHDCDVFVLTVEETRPKFYSTKKLKNPLKNDEKRTGFIMKAFRRIPELESLRVGGSGFDRSQALQKMESISHHQGKLTNGEVVATRRANGVTTFQIQSWHIDLDLKKDRMVSEQVIYDTNSLKTLVEEIQYVRDWLKAGTARLMEAPQAETGTLRDHQMM
jgi:hypothetical protein